MPHHAGHAGKHQGPPGGRKGEDKAGGQEALLWFPWEKTR